MNRHTALALRLLAPLFAIGVVLIAASAASAAVEGFGGWMLNRQTSNLTREPASAETVILIPWGQSGWVWNSNFGRPVPAGRLVSRYRAPT